MPEYSKFEQVGADNLVDPNSGNFNYVIPLIEVPGPGGSYPLSLSYHSGIEHGQEASWVGLGWTLNAGNINRMVRGVPDDYLNSVVTTWNKFSESGASVDINVGYGPFGLSMSFDANNGSFQGATPSLSLPVAGPVGITLTPGGFSVGISKNIGLAGVSMNLYDSRTGSSGKIGWSAAGVSGQRGVGVTAGAGSLKMNNVGVELPPVYGFSLGLGYTDWVYTLDEHVDDHMCGFLYQDGNKSGFVNSTDFWQASSGPVPGRYLKGTGGVTPSDVMPDQATDADYPRQRFERTLLNNTLFPSSDFYTVAASGCGGTFEPYVEPADPSVTQELPEYLDANATTSDNRNNEGWYVKNPASTNKITFRMDGDLGGNLLQSKTRSANQINPYLWNYDGTGSSKSAKPFGDQYGSQRIVPVFEKGTDGKSLNRIRGFRILNSDGMVYEFLQPLNDIFSADMVFEDPSFFSSNNSIKYMPEKYAYTWLITAIKGADYVTQNPSQSSWDALPAAGDLGHWVKFNYTTPKLTTYSTPYSGNMPNEEGDGSASSLRYLRSFGVKEIAYLSSIETETHIAQFKTATRLDDLPNRLNLFDANLANLYNPADQPQDQAVSARGVPRNVQHYSTTEYDWSDDFEIPGDWKSKVDQCGQISMPVSPAISCNDLFFINLDARFQHYSGTSWTYTHATLTGTFSNGIISNIQLNSAGNTTFHASWKVIPSNGDNVVSVTVPQAGIKWSRLFAILGNQANFPLLGSTSDAAPMPFVENKLLSNIFLSKKDATGNPSTLLKSVSFSYNYSLCPGTPNSTASPKVDGWLMPYYTTGSVSGGKLTLVQVQTQGYKDGNTSNPTSLQPYKFTYQSIMDGPVNGNPPYGDEYHKDIWGMYKDDGAINNHLVDQPARNPGSSNPNNPTYPVGSYAPGVAWNLIGVKTPTGGTINVQYTRDKYYFAGLGKDPAGNNFIVPDIYTNAIPQLSNGDIDISQLQEIVPSYKEVFPGTTNNQNEAEPVPLYQNLTSVEMASGIHTSSAGGAVHIRKKPEGPSNANKIKFASATPGISKGDMLLVVYQMWDQGMLNGSPTSTHDLLTTGILNLVSIDDITSDGYCVVRPLLVSDVDGTFYVYKDFARGDGAMNFTFKYYAYRLNNRSALYGGDVAVTQIDLADGLGNKITKKFDYDAFDIRAGAAPLGTIDRCTQCGYASGATFGLPSVYWDRYYRYIPVSTSHGTVVKGQLRMETYFDFNPLVPKFINPNGTDKLDGIITPDNPDGVTTSYNPTGANLNPMKTFVDQAFFGDTKDGGYYWTAPGITYARAKEYYVAQSDGSKFAGEIERQFQNLNFKAVNESDVPGVYANVTDVSNWIVSKSKTALSVSNYWAGKKGQLVRILNRANDANGTIVKSEEMKFASTVATYSGTGSGNIAANQQLGWLGQSFISNIANQQQTVTVTFPTTIVVGKTESENNVPVQTDFLAFDPMSGEPLAVQKTNSDGSAFVDYQVPAYWSMDAMAMGNRWKPSSEERKYKLSSGNVFNRDDYSKIVSAKASIWSSSYNGYWSADPVLGLIQKPPMKTDEYVWSQSLNALGLPEANYSPFTGSPSDTWFHSANNSYFWKNSQSIQTTNAIGTKSLIIPNPWSGHPMAVLSGADYNEVAISTFQFPEDLKNKFNNGANAWTLTGNGFASSSSITPFSPNSWRIPPGASMKKSIQLHPTGRRGIYLSVFAEVTGQGGSVIRICPLASDGSPLPYETVIPVTATSAAQRVEQYFDWSGSQYASATAAKIEFDAGSSESLSLSDLRATPPSAQVNTFYYEPNTMQMSAVLNESCSSKYFEYDGLGRLVKKYDSNHNLVGSAAYNNYQD